MADYTILINADLSTREFSYTNLTLGADATTIVLVNGDRVIWVLDQALPQTTFQIDFGAINPFHLGQAVSFRGANFAMSSVVNLPKKWVQDNNNPVFEYSVTLGNGWKDDPRCLVVPEPPDPTLEVQILALLESVANPDCAIQWKDSTETSIDLLPSPTDISVDTGTHKTKTVIFEWAAGQPDTQPFSLIFSNPPAGWPTALNDGGTGMIAPSLPPGSKTDFIITTISADQTTTPRPSATGTLTVTQPHLKRAG